MDSDFAELKSPRAGKGNKTENVVSMSKLFSFADGKDKTMMAVGAVCAMAVGVMQPLQIIVFGDVVNAFNPKEAVSLEVQQDAINAVVLKFMYIAVATVILGFGQVASWTISASRQARRLRHAYVSAILRQEIGWFDVNEPMQLASKVADHTITIQDGMGRKVADGFQFFAMAVGGVIIGVWKGWELGLSLLAFTPIIAFSAFVMMKTLASLTQGSADAYGKAGGIAQETLSNIRTILSFNATKKAADRYASALDEAEKVGIKKGIAVGTGTGFMFFTVFVTYAFGMYYGGVLVSKDQLGDEPCVGNGCYDGGRVLIVFFSVIMGAMALGQAGPSMQAIFSAKGAAHSVFQIIDRESKIDAESNVGEELSAVEGRISIQNITFRYPSRPNVVVCENYSLDIEAGQTVALVGASGSGKSTIVNLLERYYDPEQGIITIDGKDISKFNVRSLRQQIGLVGQEPALFQTSIAKNIGYGKPGATLDEIHDAAKKANAYDFIMGMPQGFDTSVGDHGVQLSGGQKQRIAIARAILKDPPILLLDEATSALDTESERIVQKSLDSLLTLKRRTTIVIAHRLSTIQEADKIAVVNNGTIIELGSHAELMAISNGNYKSLVEKQQLNVVPLRRATGDASKHATSRPGCTFNKMASRLSSKFDEEEFEDEQSLYQVSNSRIWSLSKPDTSFLIIGCLGGGINAATYPVWGVLLTKVVTLFFNLRLSKDEMQERALWWGLSFAALGVVFATSLILQNYGFAVVSERLTKRLRIQGFSAMLEQEVGWYDLDENSSGALTTRLASDTAMVQSNTSEMLNRTIVSIFTMVVALSITFYYSWQMTLVLVVVFPILMIGFYVQMQTISGGSNKKGNDGDVKAGSLLAESVGNIRTVASFNMEKRLNGEYYEFLSESKNTDMRHGFIGGVGFGVSQGLLFAVQGFLFYIGGIFVKEEIIDFEAMFGVLLVIMLSSFGIGSASQNMTDAGKAKIATSNIFSIIDRVSNIPASDTSGEKPAEVVGDITFSNIAFSYPTRPDVKVYKNYTLNIRSGQTCALVGASGGGKSTAIALLERFYVPSKGSILLDGTDISKLNISWLRDHISLVGQEPVLFAGTIAENIAYGKPTATREEIHEAAKQSNAYDFISLFPDGFDTDVGDRGVQVSGGQKQRIALARSIIRDPQVLLLDEATSALDSESEQIVQKSLDRLLALRSRTTIVIAHRLSTIQDADIIAVVGNGCIAEIGKHDELMQIEGGLYRSLVAKQMNVDE